jgi:hypothetical protein
VAHDKNPEVYKFYKISASFYINNKYLSQLSHTVCAIRNNGYNIVVNNLPSAPARSQKNRQNAKNKRNKSEAPSVARGAIGKPPISRSGMRLPHNAPPGSARRPVKLMKRIVEENNNNMQ